MPRTANIVSRVFRNLKRHGINIDDVLDEELYDELINAQDRIISDVFTDKIISITLIEDQDTYLLTTDDVDVDDDIIDKQNIASVKVVQIPTGWKPFRVIPNLDFVKIVNKNQEEEGQPCIGTIIDGKLKIFPVPGEEHEGEILKLYTYLSSSAGVISATAEPELPEMFDKAFEFFATAQFLSGEPRLQWEGNFEREVARLKPIPNRKHHNITRPSIPGTW